MVSFPNHDGLHMGGGVRFSLCCISIKCSILCNVALEFYLDSLRRYFTRFGEVKHVDVKFVS